MAAPYQVRLDPENARELATRGATIVLLDVPEGTAVGIDHQTFLVGPKFKGVKMIPPGVHAVTYASSSIDSYGPTTAFFTSLRGSEVAVWRWAPTEEVLHRVNDESQLAGITAAVKNFQLDENLAPYDLASYPLWRQLAGKVTPGVLDRVTPIGGNINILAEAPPAAASTPAEQALEEHLQQGREARRAVQAGQVTGSLSDPNEQAVGANPSPSTEAAAASGERAGERAEDLHPTLAAPHAGRCFFTPLPRLVKRQGLSPAELTALNLDKSGVLEDLLVKKFGGSEDDFLGEFQFAFLAFLLGHSLAGFSQWKDFLRLMFGCEDAAVGGRSRLFAAFLNALHAQLVHSLAPGCSPDHQAAPLGTPMVDELLADSFLRRLCTNWLRWIAAEGPTVPEEVAEAARRVGAVVQRTLGWDCGPVRELGGGRGWGDGDEEADDDEDGPVVVEGVTLPDDA